MNRSTLSKRLRTPGSGNTPSHKRHASTPCPASSRKQLFPDVSPIEPVTTPRLGRSGPRFVTRPSPHTRLATPHRSERKSWSKAELQSLVQFIALHKDLQPTESVWPSMKASHHYWKEAVSFISSSAKCTVRKASAARNIVTKVLKKYNTIDDAEEDLDLGIDNYSGRTSILTNTPCSSTSDTSINNVFKCFSRSQLIELFYKVVDNLSDKERVSAVQYIVGKLDDFDLQLLTTNIFKWIAPNNKVSLLDSMFVFVAKTIPLNIQELTGYIDHSLRGMTTLHNAQQPNALYKFARSLSVQRENGKPLFPIDRMPWGLVLYQIQFFNSSHINQIKIPEDYYQWCETVASQGLGATTIIKVMRGPMWSSCSADEKGKPPMAKVNLAFPSYVSLNRRLKHTNYLTSSDIQMEALNSLPKDVSYWVKLDGTDVKPALMESMTGVWSGDVDLGDGSLQSSREEYDNRICLHDAPSCQQLVHIDKHIEALLDDVMSDSAYLVACYETSVKLYQAKLQMQSSSQATLKELAWECVEVQTLIEQMHDISADLKRILMLSMNDMAANLLTSKSTRRAFLRNLYKKKRQAATHILVIMVSSERRNIKPYAMPVQYIPYHSLRDQFVRDLVTKLKIVMVQMGLLVTGVVTDGEFHTLRSRGDTRAVHIYQLIHDAKDVVRKMSATTLTRMLRDDAAEESPVPQIVSQRIQTQVEAGVSFEAAVEAERNLLVPAPHQACTFRPATPESHLDRMRSLVATYVYRAEIAKYEAEGIDFRTKVYVPEDIHDRGDHNHILKRIATATRDMKYGALSPLPFDEALLDPNTGLTHAALTGLRKQSVPDAEQLLSFNMARFLSQRGYLVEAEYVRTIAEWHEASDGRGLHQLQRCRQNYAMLNYLLDDWMPWHRDVYDFSLMDINRSMNDIRGFTYQTLIDITANIESQEMKRADHVNAGFSEHPRAATTDDVECFFSLVRRHLGGTFTLKEFSKAFPRIVREFVKRMRDDLPFYYWTLNERFVVEQDNFDDAKHNDMEHNYHDEDVQRLHRLVLNHREDAGIFAAGRAFLPARHRPHVRERLYRPDVGLPPVPQDQLNILARN